MSPATPPQEFQELSLELGLDEAPLVPATRSAGLSGALIAKVARRLGVSEDDLPDLAVLRTSIDARHGKVRFRLLIGQREPNSPPLGHPDPRQVGTPRVIIVGDGPAGLFCAHELARLGIGSLVLDRGKPVQPRRHDLKTIQKRGEVPPDSNYCFGEGGAGTYSDGKLYTRAHKRGSVRDVLEVLARNDAPESILVDARPHIGSNRLPKVVTRMRERLEQVGVQFQFSARVTGLTRKGGRVTGVELSDGQRLEAEAVVLATGHSARDVFSLLIEAGAPLEAKPFAMGVRIEHPQPLINRMQYGKHGSHPALPNAPYSIRTQVGSRGVFSFCMCPGGFVVPASTGPGEIVVNGMSLSRRDSPFANSGLVVSIEIEDLSRAGLTGALAGVHAQQKLEQSAYGAGAGGGDAPPSLQAPAARVTDFIQGKGSSTLPASSYIPGLASADLDEVLDAAGLPLSEKIRQSFAQFKRALPGYVTAEAVLIGVETRTSCPVRVPRDKETLQCLGLSRLYPCGEGAGYAGGIVSAALDGVRVAKALARELPPEK